MDLIPPWMPFREARGPEGVWKRKELLLVLRTTFPEELKEHLKEATQEGWVGGALFPSHENWSGELSGVP